MFNDKFMLLMLLVLQDWKECCIHALSEGV